MFFNLYRFIQKQVSTFFDTPIHSTPLALFRISIGLICLIDLFCLRINVNDLLGDNGWLSWHITYRLSDPNAFHIVDIHTLLSRLGFQEISVDYLLINIGFASSFLLLIGFLTRVSAFLTAFIYTILINSMLPYNYGVDNFIQIGLFYLIFMPSGRIWSMDNWLGFSKNIPTSGAKLSIRVLQMHLCLVYYSAGTKKVPYDHWWNGEMVWWGFIRPDSSPFDFLWLKQFPSIAIILGILVLVFEVGYIFFVWIPKIRLICIISIVLMHLTIIFVVGIPLFGLTLICFNVCSWWTEIATDVKDIINGNFPLFKKLKR